MRKMQWVVLCFLSATMAWADSGKDAVNVFRDSMGTGQLVLKNFSGEEKVLASWSGDALDLKQPRWRTLGVLVVDSVRLKGQTLTLECIRHVVVRDKNDKVVLYATPAPVEIDVDLRGADPTAALPRLKEALFYLSVQDALAALPKTVQQVLPARFDKTGAQAATEVKDLKPHCDCADKGCDAERRGTEGIVPPKFLKGGDPGYSDQARKARLNGAVNVRLIVNKEGHPTDLWVARPLGMGLDESAAKSVLTYVFRPAMCHDSPVSVYLSVDVNFEIH